MWWSQNVFCIWEGGTKMMREALFQGWSLLTYGLSSKVSWQRCGTFDLEHPENVSICRSFVVWGNLFQQKTSRFLPRKSKQCYQYIRSWVGQEKLGFYRWVCKHWLDHTLSEQLSPGLCCAWHPWTRVSLVSISPEIKPQAHVRDRGVFT